MNTVHPASGFKKKSVVSACSVLLKMQPGSAAEDVLGSSVITRCVCLIQNNVNTLLCILFY